MTRTLGDAPVLTEWGSADRTRPCSPIRVTVEQSAGPDHVLVHLAHELLDGAEPDRVPQPRGERQRNALAVQVPVEVQDERLDPALTTGEGRVRADADCGDELLAGGRELADHAAGVDAVGRDRAPWDEAEVGGRVADRPS